MKTVVQRVSSASVHIDGKVHDKIGQGIVVFLGIGKNDTLKDVEYLAEKVANLRIFTDQNGKMSFSIKDLGLEALVISQFTLYGDVSQGRRPDFTEALEPAFAEPLYKEFIVELQKKLEKPVASGSFGAKMQIHLINEGPVTIVISSKKLK
jgi:D-aminoacyl-tRNA deacylase